MTPERQTLAAIRFGYGLRPGQDAPDDAQGLLAQLKAAQMRKARFPREGIVGRREATTRMISLRAAEAKAAREGKPNDSVRRETLREARRAYRVDSMARLAQAVHSRFGFHERLATFWMDHFSTNATKTVTMRMIVPLYEAEAIRPNMAGSFADLLSAAILHPAMLIYLDQAQSVGPNSPSGVKRNRGLNENLGRELLELYTLGARSGYTQEDVRAAALVLTGLNVDNHALVATYNPRFAETGPISLLGQQYRDDESTGQDHVQLLQNLAAHPKTAAHICRKLAAHFISDEPPQEIVEAMTAAWQESDGNLTEVYRALLEHPLAWSGPAQKIKQPFEFIVSGMRALGLPDENLGSLLNDLDGEEDDDPGPVGKAMQMARSNKTAEVRKKRADHANALTLGALTRMGQPLWLPPSPAGFADTVDAWLTPSQLSERITWAQLAGRLLAPTLAPTDFLEAALADAATPETRRIISQAPSRLHGITMVLASPEFNRR